MRPIFKHGLLSPLNPNMSRLLELDKVLGKGRFALPVVSIKMCPNKCQTIFVAIWNNWVSFGIVT